MILFAKTMAEALMSPTTSPHPKSTTPLVDLWRTEEDAAIECFVRSMRVAGAPDSLIAEAIRTRNDPREP